MHAVDWEAVGVIAGIVFTVVGGVARLLAGMIRRVSEHLDAQDRAKEDQVDRETDLSARVTRIEGHLDLPQWVAAGRR